MNSPDNIIETYNLTCRFGKFTAVDRLNITIPRGSIYGFIGSNGSGKSTTIRMLCGLLRPTDGTAMVLGHDAATDTAALKQRIGYMSQKFSLYHDLTATENLSFYAGLYGLSGKAKTVRIEEILNLLLLTEKCTALAGTLSGGTRQRLALGCAILHRPELLILDEPTSAVDPTSRRLFWNLLATLVAQGTSFLVTTHFMDEAEHCDTIGFLKSGRLLACGSPQQLKQELPAHLITIPDHPAAALQALQSSSIPYLDAYIFGQSLHILLNPDTPANILPNAVAAELTMEDVFVYYDKQQQKEPTAK